MTDAERAAWVAERAARRDAAGAVVRARRERTAAAAAGDACTRLVIHCGYNDLMNPQEIKSLAQQLARCVAHNARAARPALLAFAGVTGPLEAALAKMDGHAWPIVRLGEFGDPLPAPTGRAAAVAASATTPFPPSLIYLSADADAVLDAEATDPRTALVVGGLVDRNRHKGAATERADAAGVPAARLPLDSVRLSASAVLTVDQVVDLLLRRGDGAAWGEAAAAAVPRRKQRGDDPPRPSL
jgi:tRNA (guanine9-N1)-methyltransferase